MTATHSPTMLLDVPGTGIDTAVASVVG